LGSQLRFPRGKRDKIQDQVRKKVMRLGVENLKQSEVRTVSEGMVCKGRRRKLKTHREITNQPSKATLEKDSSSQGGREPDK